MTSLSLRSLSTTTMFFPILAKLAAKVALAIPAPTIRTSTFLFTSVFEHLPFLNILNSSLSFEKAELKKTVIVIFKLTVQMYCIQYKT